MRQLEHHKSKRSYDQQIPCAHTWWTTHPKPTRRHGHARLQSDTQFSQLIIANKRTTGRASVPNEDGSADDRDSDRDRVTRSFPLPKQILELPLSPSARPSARPSVPYRSTMPCLASRRSDGRIEGGRVGKEEKSCAALISQSE